MGWSLRAKQVATGEVSELDIVEQVVLLAFSSRFRNSCRAEEAAEKVVVASRLRPSAAGSVSVKYVRPKGRTVQKFEFSRSL
jgi:hypothetical protein